MSYLSLLAYLQLQSFNEPIRSLAPSQQDYKDQCDGVSIPIEPKVDKNSGKLLETINDSRNDDDRVSYSAFLKTPLLEILKKILVKGQPRSNEIYYDYCPIYRSFYRSLRNVSGWILVLLWMCLL